MDNLHGTAVVLGRHGVLIRGASGTGKTTLALELLHRAAAGGLFAALVADDQLLLSATAGRLLATAPSQIAGLAEVHGLGPARVHHVSAAVIDLVLTLGDGATAPRFQEPERFRWGSVEVPELTLGKSQTRRSVAVAFAHLGLELFAGVRQNG